MTATLHTLQYLLRCVLQQVPLAASAETNAALPALSYVLLRVEHGVAVPVPVRVSNGVTSSVVLLGRRLPGLCATQTPLH